MVKCGSLFKECVKLLEQCDSDSAHFDTMCIFQDVLGEKNIYLNYDKTISDCNADKIRKLIRKRAEQYPLQYLLGEWEFFGYPFKTGEGVLIPRPDTETLVERVIKICCEKNKKAPIIADLCSGTGCIAVTLKKEIPDAEIYAVELSDNALEYLRQNVVLNNADIHIIKGDVLSNKTIEQIPEADIIVSNPPYLTSEEMNNLQTEVSFEPSMALFGGTDGLDFYRIITDMWKNILKKGGFIAYEFGFGQHDAVKRILYENGFANIILSKDTAGIIRTAEAEKL